MNPKGGVQMTDVAPERQSFVAAYDQPLIGVPFEAAAEAALTDEDMWAALNAIGSWSDLDWDDMAEALDRNRHDSEPTPPIDL